MLTALKHKNNIIFINPEYKETLIKHVLNNFKGLSPISSHKGRVDQMIYEVNKERLIVKKCKRGGAVSWLGWIHTSPKKVLNEITMNQMFRKAGLNVPEIVAAKVTWYLALFKMMIIEREVQGKTLYDMAKERPLPVELVRNLATDIKKLHEAGIAHGDLNLKNILISPDLKIFFVDLSAASTSKNGIGEIARLNRSCEKLLAGKIDNRRKLVFLSNYLQSRDGLQVAIQRCEKDLRLHRLFWQ